MPLWACSAAADSAAHITGGFTGNDHARGHQLRDRKTWPTPAVTHRAHTVIVGGGVAGLAAARALRLREQDDFVLLELEDRAGGNARGGTVGGIACPLGAHYLPLPSDDAPEVQDLLEELGLRQRVAGRWQYDERHLCHSPQERLFFNGAWQDGLLPVHGVGEATLAQYRRFAVLVEQARQAAKWTIPTRNRPLDTVQRALVAITFIAYLDQNGLDDPQLRWYLDYCCRDDYGTGIATVSAWAGIHYFASRHGFHAPGAETAEREGLLTWPEGNAWLTRRLAAPLGDRLRTGSVVLRVAQGRHGVEVDAFNTAKQRVERWQAQQAIVALPIFIAARVVEGVPDFLRQAAQRVVYAPWLVANIHLREPLRDRPGAAPSWDNVVYGTQGLGYVDAMHQSLHPVPGATVLTHYRALGDVPGGPAAGRRQLLAQPWTYWRDTIVAELAAAHPDLAAKATRMELTRYGHAMAIPLPSNHGQIGLWPPQNLRKQLSKQKQLALAYGRLRFAHSDWAGYSIFEEAFTLGHWAGA
ncbi:FAD-dependent oxidoreductase [Rhodoferax sp. TH121]|uniref:FAD-dependent oxidoreductase n=1 Tax=Rhodoferax sp. TH121 TaxID=2022803 RepID=UPI0020CF200E|nr:FAD-dependent oxidoreductase [Rhodoferax sp. TH121]